MTAAAVLRVKKLTGCGIVRAAAAHNRRAIAAELGAASHIDASRCALNVTLTGPDTPQAVAELAQSLMDAAGVGKLRRDAVRAVEAVFSLPPGGGGVDADAYFARCVEWAGCQFGPLLSADIHHDEATPHVHVLALPLRGGRMVGSDLVGGPAKLRALQTMFHAEVAQHFGLKRGTARLSGMSREKLAATVLAHLKAMGDPALKSAAWPAIRDAIERDPRTFAETIGFDAGSASPQKPARDFATIMTGRGRRTSEDSSHKPIGFESTETESEAPFREPPEPRSKTRTLGSVGFASTAPHPKHSTASAEGRSEGVQP